MKRYFNINYEFNREAIHNKIDTYIKHRDKGYICVADGVVLNITNRSGSYRKVLDNAIFALCDSSYVPLYIKLIYGIRYQQYCGSQIFKDIVSAGRYRMAFLGASQKVLDGLKNNLSKMNPNVEDMLFYELPFLEANEFNFPAIAKMLEKDGADIIWIALGAPKQEIFMYHLLPHLRNGVMIAVGAAFKFYSGTGEKRAPEWMLKSHMEFVYRIFRDPKKQLKRCAWIIYTLPGLLYSEWKKRKRIEHLNLKQ